MQITGELDEATIQALAEWKHIPATRVVTIREEFANDQFVAIPKDRKDQAKLDRMGYASLAEKIAERFHTTDEVLAELNPQLTGGPTPPAAEAPDGNETTPKATIAYGRDATPRAEYRGRSLRPFGGQGSEMGQTRFASSASERSSLRPPGSRSTSPTRCCVCLDKRGQVACPVHRDDGLEPVPAAAGYVEDPERRLIIRRGNMIPRCSPTPTSRIPSWKFRRARTARSASSGSTCRRSITVSTAPMSRAISAGRNPTAASASQIGMRRASPRWSSPGIRAVFKA